MKKKIKDLTLEEVFKLKSNCFCTSDCENCPLNYREDGIQSELCELVNEIENTTFVESFLEQEIEVLPLIKEEEEINLTPLYAYYNLSEYVMKNFPEEKIKKIIEEESIKKLSKHIRPEFILEDTHINGRIVKAKIELPSKYVKGVKDDVN